MRTQITFILAFFLSLPALAIAENQVLIQKIVEKAKVSTSDSVVIVQDQNVILSSFFGKGDQVHNVQSVTKSVAGLALAILLEENKLQSFDQPMSDWIPEWKTDSQKSKITLRMVMNHTSGYPDMETWPDFFKGSDLVADAIQIPLLVEPGSQFHYSSIATILLQRVIATASGQSVESFVNEKIFFPMEITDSKWKKDKAGHEHMGGGLFLSTADLLKLGQLVLNEGRFNKKTILQPESLQALLVQSQPYKKYGLLWWLQSAFGSAAPEKIDLVTAAGWGGQYITIYPAKKLVAVRTKDPYTIDEDHYDEQDFHEFKELISQWQ